MSIPVATRWYEIVTAFLIICFVVWFLVTIIAWTQADCTDMWVHNNYGENCTLVDVLKSQWEWLKELSGHIV